MIADAGGAEQRLLVAKLEAELAVAFDSQRDTPCAANHDYLVRVASQLAALEISLEAAGT